MNVIKYQTRFYYETSHNSVQSRGIWLQRQITITG